MSPGTAVQDFGDRLGEAAFRKAPPQIGVQFRRGEAVERHFGTQLMRLQFLLYPPHRVVP